MNRIYLSLLFVCSLTVFAAGCGSTPNLQQGYPGTAGYAGSALANPYGIPSPYGYGLASQVPYINNGYGYNGVYGSCPLGYVYAGGVCTLGAANMNCGGAYPGYSGSFGWNGGMCVGSGLSAYNYSGQFSYQYGAFVNGGIYHYPRCHFASIFWACY